MDRQTSETQETFIQVDNVHKSFLMGKEAVQALRGVSLDVARGEMVCLMGPSGSGKTTLLNIIGGLEEPSRGHVSVDGENIVALSEDALMLWRGKGRLDWSRLADDATRVNSQALVQRLGYLADNSW